jgi:hypothetical protein
MMRAGLSLAAALALATPGVAKPVYGQPSDDLSVQAMHNFAGCIADTTPKGAVEVLALDFRSPEYAKRLHRFSEGHADGRCLGGHIQYNGVLLAGGMAERLLVEKMPANRFATAVAYDPAKAPIVARNAMELISICVLRAEPDKTYAIFGTDPTSADEAHTMQAIAPTLTNCIKAGQQVSLNKPGLRASLALAAYRLTQPEPVASADAKPMNPSVVNQ